MDAKPTILELFGDSFSEPMRLSELAEIFGCSRDVMRRIVARWPEADIIREGSLRRICIRHLPYPYLVRSLSPADVATIGDIWRQLQNGRSRAA